MFCHHQQFLYPLKKTPVCFLFLDFVHLRLWLPIPQFIFEVYDILDPCIDWKPIPGVVQSNIAEWFMSTIALFLCSVTRTIYIDVVDVDDGLDTCPGCQPIHLVVQAAIVLGVPRIAVSISRALQCPLVQ